MNAESIISEVIRLAAGAGLWSLALAILLVSALVIVGVRAGVFKLRPAPPEQRDDVQRGDVPDADSSWQTDPEHPGGDNVGGA